MPIKKHLNSCVIKSSGLKNLKKRHETTQRYLFRIEYDGASYGGWQKQLNAPSIQEKIEHAFSTATRIPCSIVGAGRTDAGVHARRQAAHIDIPPVRDIERLRFSINSILPGDIQIFEMKPVSSDIHARFSAVKRRYCYYMNCENHPLVRHRAWTIMYAVNWNRVRKHVSSLLGTHDFSTFCSSGSGTENMTCKVTEAALTCNNDMFIFSITADRFIYKMVRSIVGTLIDIGRGRLMSSMAAIIKSHDRTQAGNTAPSKGLILENIEYPEDL
ncbi:MAG: tRNA pseudouridine(38-40) synthase TruA [Chitinivibrionales bacterium]|nr:tRNA pseudouridine(38-40) synthase TruA [Chitinivibrionales bacterium]